MYFFALSNSLYFALPITPFTPDSCAIARHSLTVSIPSPQHPIIHFQPVDFGILLSSFTSLTTKKTSDKTQFSISTILSGLAATAAAFPTEMVLQKRGIISATPHVEYSSSVGVLGCKINTNRVSIRLSAARPMVGPNFLAVMSSGDGKLLPWVKSLVEHSKRGFVFGTVRLRTR